MKRYEYKIVTLQVVCQDIEEELNKFGEEGWEVYFCRDKNLIHKFMKENPIYKECLNVPISLYERYSPMMNSEYYLEFYLKRIKED